MNFQVPTSLVWIYFLIMQWFCYSHSNRLFVNQLLLLQVSNVTLFSLRHLNYLTLYCTTLIYTCWLIKKIKDSKEVQKGKLKIQHWKDVYRSILIRRFYMAKHHPSRKLSICTSTCKIRCAKGEWKKIWKFWSQPLLENRSIRRYSVWTL